MPTDQDAYTPALIYEQLQDRLSAKGEKKTFLLRGVYIPAHRGGLWNSYFFDELADEFGGARVKLQVPEALRPSFKEGYVYTVRVFLSPRDSTTRGVIETRVRLCGDPLEEEAPRMSVTELERAQLLAKVDRRAREVESAWRTELEGEGVLGLALVTSAAGVAQEDLKRQLGPFAKHVRLEQRDVNLSRPSDILGALESAVDELARALGMDPLELRQKNYTGRDQKQDKPYSSPEGLKRAYERVAGVFGWDAYQEPPTNGPKRRGVGIAANSWMAGKGNPPGYAFVKLNHDGSADVVTGAQDIGTGTRTGLVQVAAEVLGLPTDRVRIHLGDTANQPFAPTSAGSATLATLGPAVRAAAANVRTQLLKAAATLLDVDADRLSVKDGGLYTGDEADPALKVSELTQRLAPHMLQGHGARDANPDDVSIRTFGAQCAEVEVDILTGEVTVLRVVAAPESGRVINPTTVESQVIGGVTQGVGYALSEERVVDERLGVVLNANLEEYKIPTVADIPRITYASVDLPDLNANPTGAKGIGEPPLIPTAPAIANAIFDAVGVRLRDLPLSRRRLVEALAEKEPAQKEVTRPESERSPDAAL